MQTDIKISPSRIVHIRMRTESLPSQAEQVIDPANNRETVQT